MESSGLPTAVAEPFSHTSRISQEGVAALLFDPDFMCGAMIMEYDDKLERVRFRNHGSTA
jgi:hypothetical protein